METDFTSIDAGQDPGSGHCGQDLVCGRDIRTLTCESLRREKATISRTGTPIPPRAHLQSVAQPEGAQPDKPR